LRGDREIARAAVHATSGNGDSSSRNRGKQPLGGRSMKLTIRTLLLLIAVILFVIAAFGVDVRGISLIAAGLAFFAASFIAPDTAVGRQM
jgi:uncharacterized membrane protein